MEKEFEGKVALITGSSFGIGKATAILFASKGAKVVLSDYIEDDETLNTIKNNGGEAIFVKCDVSKEAEVKAMIDQTIETYGQLDYAFNNAGIEGEQGTIDVCSNDNWNSVINVNLFGVMYCMKYQIPQMVK